MEKRHVKGYVKQKKRDTARETERHRARQQDGGNMEKRLASATLRRKRETQRGRETAR